MSHKAVVSTACVNMRRVANLEKNSRMMRSIRKRAPTWLTRRMGSQECLLDKPNEPSSILRNNTKTEFEITSIKAKHLLEKGKFQEVVDMLREQSHNHIQHCLESFPFKILNKLVPKSFAIWETLLMKLHNSEDGYIPKFPYAACDELVLQIGQLLERVEDMPQDNADLIHACKRVLKKVYMQYTGVLKPLIKENKRTEYAIYSLSLHLPIGTDRMAVALHTAIKNEVEACVADFQSSLERIDEIEKKESFSLSQMLTGIPQDGKIPNSVEPVVEFKAPSPSQIQLQERLYCNQCIMRALEPNQRDGNLAQLMEMLKARILGDKAVISLFGGIRLRNGFLLDSDAVEPWLRKHQRAVECSIAMLNDIEKELQLNVSQHPPSPAEAGSELSSSLEDSSYDFLTVPVLQFMTPPTEDHLVNRPPSIRRASAVAPMLFNIGEKEGEDDETEKMTRRYSVPPHSGDKRPRSTSPMKFLRTNGISRNTNGAQNSPTEDGSCKSLDSSHGSSRSLNGRESSSSIHDLNSTSDTQLPTQAFRRAQSLKAKGRYAVTLVTPQPTLPLVAGRKKAETLHHSSTNLSTATENKSSKLKNMFRCGSGGLVGRWDTHQQRGDVVNVGTNLVLELEFKNKEILKREKLIYELQRRERELTDRLSEQAQSQLQYSEKFEDILLGASRATVVIQRYEGLYSQERMEALDAIEAVQIKSSNMSRCEAASTAAMDASDMFNVRFLLDVFKGAYHSAWNYLQQLHSSWRELLGIPGAQQKTVGAAERGKQHSREASGQGEGVTEDAVIDDEEERECKQMAEKQLESAITVYLRRVCRHQDIAPMMKSLRSRLDAKYSNHPVYTEVKSLPPFTDYMEECVKVAWGLCIQTPHMIIRCKENVYNPDFHKRFYNADKNSKDIVMYMWPMLTQLNGPVLVRGIVLT